MLASGYQTGKHRSKPDLDLVTIQAYCTLEGKIQIQPLKKEVSNFIWKQINLLSTLPSENLTSDVKRLSSGSNIELI